MDYIKRRVLEFIEENDNQDSVDVIFKFKSLNPDTVLEVLFELEKENIVKREYCGMRTKYVIVNSEVELSIF